MDTKARRRLPIGLQAFRELREEDCYYVDKTGFIARLLDEGKHYFISRPRRFGKSLLLDTLKELFEGNEALFSGLYIHDRWDWSERHPVVRLDFGSGSFGEPGYVHSSAMAQLAAAAQDGGVAARYDTAPERFRDLLRVLHARTGRRVVVLVDEYDKPLLDALDTPDVARANRDYLLGLYSTIKSSDADVHFTLLSGVSKFSMASVFSGLNNLTDITLDPRYSAICGYTEADLDTVFAPELDGLDREQIRDWYNGYNWRGAEKMYNPFDILLLFDRREFGCYSQRRISSMSLDGMLTSGDLLSSFDVGAIATEALLFQTGYLTIKSVRNRGGVLRYRLGYPNREVRQSLNESLLRRLVQDSTRQTANSDRLYDLLEANDFAGMETLFQAFFASIPYEWYTNNAIADYEGYYASVFYSYFAATGFDVTVEDSSNRGRADMAVRFGGNVYLFEFKVVEQATEGAALAQLKERGYADKYRARGEPIHLIGVEFSKETRNVKAFEVERG